jgi:hypothetical protein
MAVVLAALSLCCIKPVRQLPRFLVLVAQPPSTLLHFQMRTDYDCTVPIMELHFQISEKLPSEHETHYNFNFKMYVYNVYKFTQIINMEVYTQDLH